MSADVGERYAVRVMVTPAWEQVPVQVDNTTTVAQLKREALRAALKRAPLGEQEYIVKFRGAAVLDESLTLRALGAVPNAPFIVLPARRQPVR
ncbi:MAG: hypothetical protein DMD48_00015 [Gemmatimonadetes bacterium]|nr:MAG: hypothetical protein DMD48_00015 [Gemmatimonadota bacterium]